MRFLGVQLCPKVQSKVPNTGFVRKSVHKVLFNPRMGGGERVTDLLKVVELVKCVNLE